MGDDSGEDRLRQFVKEAIAAKSRRDFAEDDVKGIFYGNGGQCMCERPNCDQGHAPKPCNKQLTWSKRGHWGDSDAWQADHKNGKPSDNRKSNCQILCSDCHQDKPVA